MRAFEAECPRSLEEVLTAVSLLSRQKANFMIKAGGTDLLIWIKKRAVSPGLIVDISFIPELSGIVFSPEKGLRISAAATVNETAASPGASAYFPGLAEACLSHSDQLIRNKATVVGNVCSAVPSGDLLPILGVYEAQVCLLSLEGKRRVPIEDFITGPRKTVLEKNEIVSHITVPVPGGVSASCYLKQGRRNSLDLAQAGVACLARDENGTRSYRLVCGAVAPTPVRVREAEKVLHGIRLPDEASLEKAAEKAMEAVLPITDVRASKEYRRAQVGELVKRAVLICSERLGRDDNDG